MHPSLALSHEWPNQRKGPIDPPENLIVTPKILAHVGLVWWFWLLSSLLVHHLAPLNIFNVEILAIHRLFILKPLLQTQILFTKAANRWHWIRLLLLYFTDLHQGLVLMDLYIK